jgi:hypothetical protein
MRRRGRSPAIVVGVACILVLGGGCSSDSKPKSGITIDTLAASTGTACPVPFEVAADNSGIDTPNPATGEVRVGHPSTEVTGSTPSTTPLAEADGVEVDCTLQLADGTSVDLLLVAARSDGAALLVLPAAAAEAKLSKDQATQLGNDVSRTEEGELIPMPGDQAVAMMATDVSAATSAAMVISADGLKRAQVEQIARQLDQRL